MVYATFDYYVNAYHGALISEERFAVAIDRASRFLDYYTRNKAAAAAELDELKTACCAIAEEVLVQMQAEDAARQAAGGSVKSQTVGSFSVTYQSREELLASAKESQKRMVQIARQHLAHTGLLYRGGC